MRVLNVTVAEVVKLRGMPVVLATVVATIAAAVALAAGLSSSASTPPDPTRTTLALVPYLQIGLILLGILAVATEYQGQVRTTLIATPARLRLLAGKTLAYLVVAAATGLAAVGAGFATAWLLVRLRQSVSPEAMNGCLVAGACLYLVLIGLLGLVLTVALRSLIPPLVTMLGLVFIVSPLVRGYSEYGRWLPDRAGALLYRPVEDTLLTPWSGGLVLAAWIVVTAIAAAALFLTRDA